MYGLLYFLREKAVENLYVVRVHARSKNLPHTACKGEFSTKSSIISQLLVLVLVLLLLFFFSSNFVNVVGGGIQVIYIICLDDLSS